MNRKKCVFLLVSFISILACLLSIQIQSSQAAMHKGWVETSIPYAKKAAWFLIPSVIMNIPSQVMHVIDIHKANKKLCNAAKQTVTYTGSFVGSVALTAAGIASVVYSYTNEENELSWMQQGATCGVMMLGAYGVSLLRSYEKKQAEEALEKMDSKSCLLT